MMILIKTMLTGSVLSRHKYDDSEKIAKQNMELDDLERTKSDDEFIDTEEGEYPNSDAMVDITKKLRLQIVT